MTATDHIKHILLATDFSENASLALRWAIRVLGQVKGRISLVHSIGSHGRNMKVPFESLFTEVRQHLAVAADPARRAGHSVDYHYGTDKPWALINRLADELKVDLIVLGTHGHGGLGEFVLGSTADRVVRSANVPVLAVHAKDEIKDQPLRKIMVPHDFSNEANAAANTATAILKQSGGGEIALFHACEIVVQYPDAKALPADQKYWDDCAREAKQKLDAAAETFKGKGIEVRTVIDRGIPSGSAVNMAKSMNVDLIAMGTHGRGPLQRWLIGSVAERVLQTASCPVLTVRHKE